MFNVSTLTLQADYGDAPAQFTLGGIYQAGAGDIAPNLPKAISFYFKAATQGHVEAQLRLGLLLVDDVAKAGIKSNPRQAFEWLSKAANAGNADAQHRIGLMLLDGDGIEKNEQAGIEWLEKSVAQGSSIAQFALGQRLAKGEGIEQDVPRAHQLLLQATKQDHGEATYHLAMLLENGDGFDKDLQPLAARMYVRAFSKHSMLKAAHRLAMMYAKGSGVGRDPHLAKSLFEYEVGAGGNAGMYGLGMLLGGDEVRDLPNAVMWTVLSIEHCPEDPGATLLQSLSDLATPQQIANGRMRAETWKRVPRVNPLSNPVDDADEFSEINFPAA